MARIIDIICLGVGSTKSRRQAGIQRKPFVSVYGIFAYIILGLESVDIFVADDVLFG